jgi:DNA topoisomerase III
VALTTDDQSGTRDTYTKNYNFDFDFGAPWGHAEVTMTAVRGHLTTVDFPEDYKKWEYPPPDRLFDARIQKAVAQVPPLGSFGPGFCTLNCC